MKRIFISAPYNANTKEGIQKNIDFATEEAKRFIKKGYLVYIPHKATSHLGGVTNESYFYKLHIDILKNWATHIYMCGDWTKSKGCCKEYNIAFKYNKELIE